MRQREEIKARIALGSVPISQAMQDHMRCTKCNAEFEFLFPGGVGDWRTTIVCEKCFHIRKNVPLQNVIVPLIALQGGIAEWEARQREERAHRAYLESIAKASDY